MPGEAPQSAKAPFENGFANFRMAFVNAAIPVLDEMRTTNADEYGEVFANILFDREGARSLKRPLSLREQLFMKLWHGFIEINNSFEALNDVPLYIRHFPSNATQISKLRYLHYHIINYVNEVYILTERLAAYTTVVSRAYQNSPSLKQMKIQLERAKKLPEVFDSFVRVRGAHVHVARYDDDDLDRLQLLELLSNVPDNKEPGLSRLLYQRAIRTTRKKWLEIMAKNNQLIKVILDIYFNVLHQIIFNDKNELVAPYPDPRRS